MVIALNNVRSSMGACIIIYTKTFCGVRSAVLTVTFMNYCIKYKVKLMGVVPFPDPPSGGWGERDNLYCCTSVC